MSILNFQCENAREVPKKELKSGQDLHPFSWEEKFRVNYIYLRNGNHFPCFYRVIEINASGSLGKREMLWEHQPQVGVAIAGFHQNVHSLHLAIYTS